MNKCVPPIFFLRFFRWYCHPKMQDYIEGDLLEVYDRRLKKYGKHHADVKFARDVLLLLRPGVIRPLGIPFNLNNIFMFVNHFRITVRTLWKNKVSTFINVFGLAVGLSSCLVIALYVQHEFSYDTFQLKGDRIARVIMEYSFDGSSESKQGNFTSTKVAPVFVRTFPEVESAVRMRDREMIIRYRDNVVTEQDFMFADSTFFKVFAAKMLQGNPETALDGPFKVVLTKSSARKYFGDESPLGKVLITGTDSQLYEVTGVMEDYPSNSQMEFDFLASFSSLGANQEETYYDANYTTYLLLHDRFSFEPLQEKITPFMKTETVGTGATINFHLERFDRIHLYSGFAGFVPNTNITYLYILSAVALLILVIVCFTYINLSTARSVERAREVGVRKVVGAAKFQLFWQFIGESFLLFIVAIIISINVAIAAIPYFNNLTGKQLDIRALFIPEFLVSVVALTVLVSLLAGSYPALVLSGFQPLKVLKGVFKNTHSGKWMQHSLIVFQFAITVFLTAATFIIQKQLYFIQHKELGYDRNHLLSLPMKQSMLANLEVIKQELKSSPDIISVSRCTDSPVKIVGGYNMRSATMQEGEQIAVTANPIDEDYIKTTGLEIIAGEDLTAQDMRDVAFEERDKMIHHFVLNEMAAKQLGWTAEEAIGKKMFMGGRAGFVKAVVKNFHFESMHLAIRPVVLFTEIRGSGQLLVKVKGNDISGAIASVGQKWKQLVPGVPFEYKFVDDDYDELYRSELQLGKVMNLFAGIAIVLACLGLFGLSSYVAQQRIKEIGIRKVLGASWFSIVRLLSGNFAKLVLIAIAVATPVAYYLMDGWLSDFVYRIDIEWWIFLAAGAGALLIAMCTVSYQAIKATLMNPVKSLRAE